jgi:hypothetical protein
MSILMDEDYPIEDDVLDRIRVEEMGNIIQSMNDQQKKTVSDLVIKDSIILMYELEFKSIVLPVK